MNRNSNTLPGLLILQKFEFQKFIKSGLLQEIRLLNIFNRFQSKDKNFALIFDSTKITVAIPKYSISECLIKKKTYSIGIYLTLTIVNGLKKQSLKFLIDGQ